MDDELGPADLIEEALEDQRFLGRQAAQRRARGGQIVDELTGRRLADADFVLEPGHGAGPGRIFLDQARQVSAQPRDRLRQLVAPPRRLAQPEWNGRRHALRILDPDRAALDPENAIGMVAELEHVAGHALDREVLIDRADRLVLGLEQNAVIGVVGDGAAGGQRRQPGAAAAADEVIDGVVMDDGAAPPAPGAVAFGQHLEHDGEIRALEQAIGPGAAAELEEGLLAPFLGRDLGDDLLRQHVERPFGNRNAVELALPHAVEEGGAFDQLVARQREQTALRRAIDGMAGAPDPLQEARDRPGRA